MKKFMGIIIASGILASSAFGFLKIEGGLGAISEGWMEGNGSMVALSCINGNVVSAFKILSDTPFIVPGRPYSVSYWVDDTKRNSQEFLGYGKNMVILEQGSFVHKQDFTKGSLHAVLPFVGAQEYKMNEKSQALVNEIISVCEPKKIPETPATPSSGGSGGGCFIGGLLK